MVILEITIDAAGAVSNARVHSIPLLDRAAVDAARQWRYEPTLLNGRPVPVILTATVDFRYVALAGGARGPRYICRLALAHWTLRRLFSSSCFS